MLPKATPQGGSPLGGSVSSLPYALNSGPGLTHDEAVISPAFRLIRVDKVQVLLLEHSGTFASMSSLTVCTTN